MTKVKNRLLDTDLVIYQDDEWFKFSLDSVLLAKFVTLNLRHKKIIDLASGNAPIPLLLSFRTKASIYGIEYQEMNFDESYREELMKIAETEEGLIKLWNEANLIDPQAMLKISKDDERNL